MSFSVVVCHLSSRNVRLRSPCRSQRHDGHADASRPGRAGERTVGRSDSLFSGWRKRASFVKPK